MFSTIGLQAIKPDRYVVVNKRSEAKAKDARHYCGGHANTAR